MNFVYEIDYEIESIFDEYGDFPLQCVTLLFDLLNINNNIVIKNQYSIKKEKENIILKYVESEGNPFYEWPRSPKGNYCIWVNQFFHTNQIFIDFLKLQGIYLSYIALNRSFDWEGFIKRWKDDETYLILSGEASFICNVLDMDRRLSFIFDRNVFSTEAIDNILLEWESIIFKTAGAMSVEKSTFKIKGKFGNKKVVRLKF